LEYVQLDIVAIRQSDSQNNAYVLLLNEVTGTRQLPIVIGWCEARSIAIALDGAEEPNRPLTHDLFKSFGDSFNISIQKVVIHTLIEGIFHASFYCIHNVTKEEIAIDARTSDAIALAIRYSCPIFTYEDILSRAGIIVNSLREKKDVSLDLEEDKSNKKKGLRSFSLEELKQMLHVAINQEDYEKASKIRDEINNRKNN
tara:strand:+ start:239 stop:838 length:600 start_codon:yes stop_codon:yes gene_type:complete